MVGGSITTWWHTPVGLGLSQAYVDLPGHTWLLYDENVHMRAAIHPNLRWDEPHSGLWLQTMTLAHPAQGNGFDSGHLICNAGHGNSPHVVVGQMVQPACSAGSLIHWDHALGKHVIKGTNAPYVEGITLVQNSLKVSHRKGVARKPE